MFGDMFIADDKAVDQFVLNVRTSQDVSTLYC